MQVLQTFAIRTGYAIILLMAVLVLNFSMMHLAPGDVADTISQSMGGADQEILDQIRADYGLDQPFLIQLGRYMGNVLRFDLGFSFFYNTPVTELILQRLPATLLLVFTAQILALLIGVVMGVISARNPNGETLGSDFVRTAKAKGLSPNQVVYKHALKNSLSPVITLAGLQFSAVISGAVLVEAVFSWPGLGTLAFQSIIARDTPTILGILFFSALVVIVGNLLTDLALRLIDPRVGSKG